MNHSIKKVVNPNGSFRYELRVWGRRNEGDIRRRFKYRDEATRHVESLYERQKIIATHSADPLFHDEFTYWILVRAHAFAPGWRKNVDQYWVELSPILKPLKVSQITKSLLKEIEHKLTQKGNSIKTVNSKLRFIISVLNFSLDMERIDSHKLKTFKFQKPIKKAVRVWSKEDAASFLRFANQRHSALEARWIYCVYMLALNTGMRGGEIWGLVWEDIVFQSGLIHVQRQFDMVAKVMRTTKGRENRYVPLSAALSRELQELKKQSRQFDLVFHTDGKVISHRAFTRRFERDLKKFGGQSISFHGLRHTFASNALAGGLDLKIVQTILGHKNIMTTAQYVHAFAEGVRNAGLKFSIEPEN